MHPVDLDVKTRNGSNDFMIDVLKLFLVKCRAKGGYDMTVKKKKKSTKKKKVRKTTKQQRRQRPIKPGKSKQPPKLPPVIELPPPEQPPKSLPIVEELPLVQPPAEEPSLF